MLNNYEINLSQTVFYLVYDTKYVIKNYQLLVKLLIFQLQFDVLKPTLRSQKMKFMVSLYKNLKLFL